MPDAHEPPRGSARANASAYSESVEKALAGCLPSSDPLDAADFDPVAFVNERFPDEKSFAGLDPFLAQIRAQIADLDVGIFDAVKAQSTNASRATGELAEAKSSIRQLQHKVRDIKGKAEQSEVMVQEICRDIKKLDYAKRHLTLTITSLKRFHMLATAVDQLDFMVESRQYHETANLLQAIAQLLQHFEQHNAVPAVVRLRDSVVKTREFLSIQIFRDFEALSEVRADYARMAAQREPGASAASGAAGSDAAPGPAGAARSSPGESSLFAGAGHKFAPAGSTYEDPTQVAPSTSMYYSSDAHTPESLAGACAVVDALGSSVRRKLIAKVAEIWLLPYEQLFAPGREYAGLDTTDRRYAWLRRLMRENEDRYDSIFPRAWAIDKHVLQAFVKKTEAHLKAELRKIDPPDSADVSALVRALRKTLDFEQEMTQKFHDAESESGDAKPADKELFDDDGNRVDPMSAQGIMMRRKHSRSSSVDSSKPSPESADQGSDAAHGRLEAKLDADRLPPIKGIISAAFEPYLTAYVKLEAEKMQEELDQVFKDEAANQDDALHMTSASSMFLLIQKSMNRCIQFTTGQAFYDLHIEFKKVLTDYSNKLDRKLPKHGRPLTAEGVIAACFVCNSADYCIETIPQLAELIDGKINDAFRGAVDMEDELDRFSGNLQRGLRALISGVHAHLDADMSALQRTNWATFAEVGDNSKCVTTLSSVLVKHAPRIREQLSQEAYFRKFCDDFADSFVTRFQDAVFRCKKVSDMGAQQLLLDVHAVKSALLQLPTVGTRPSDSDSGANAGANFSHYTKRVGAEMQRLEVILKLVGMQLEPSILVDNFKTLLVTGNSEDLRMVLEMKGFKKGDIQSTLRLAEQAGVPKGTPRQTSGAGSVSASLYTNLSDATATAASSAPASGTTSFTNVFYKMSDMKEHLDKVASTTSSSAKGLSSLGATFQNSYNRAVSGKRYGGAPDQSNK